MIEPSQWVIRWAPLITRGTVLDVACGGGRHSNFFLGKNLNVVAVDRVAQTIPGARFIQATWKKAALAAALASARPEGVGTNTCFGPVSAPREALSPAASDTKTSFLLRTSEALNPAFLLRPANCAMHSRDLDLKA